MANYKNIIPFIRKAEGGLSSAQTDTARRNPAPCGNGKNGYPYHTNKGIQWITFKGLSGSGGYEASCSNFLNMPDSVWEKIYLSGFWKPMKCDTIRNQAIANVFVEMAWGSGVGGATSMLKSFFKTKYGKSFSNITEIANYVNELDTKGQTPELFEQLYDFRASKYASLNQPANLKGWLNRLDAFYVLNKPYAISNSGKKNATAGLIIGVFLLSLGGIYLYKNYKK